jgi:hypothetical protein
VCCERVATLRLHRLLERPQGLDRRRRPDGLARLGGSSLKQAPCRSIAFNERSIRPSTRGPDVDVRTVAQRRRSCERSGHYHPLNRQVGQQHRGGTRGYEPLAQPAIRICTGHRSQKFRRLRPRRRRAATIPPSSRISSVVGTSSSANRIPVCLLKKSNVKPAANV